MSDIVKPSTLPGFWELLPKDQLLFDEIVEVVRSTYESFGFLPLDTPVLEKREVLLAKGGGETEKQVYQLDSGKTEMAMRFDLTVPLARYVAQHYSDLAFPFRRYHIAKVYRGERNQRGRYREFYQADIDIIGNGSLDVYHDAEVVAIIEQIFRRLDFGEFVIRINHRKMMSGALEALGVADPLGIMGILDKREKIGDDKLRELLTEAGEGIHCDEIFALLDIEGSNEEKLAILEERFEGGEDFRTGIDETKKILRYAKLLGIEEHHLRLDFSIVRGLDYYTGAVYETSLINAPELGSVCSGGRYENLAGYYTKQHLPGVGISIGLSRLFFQLKEAGILKEKETRIADAMVIPMEGVFEEAIALTRALRERGLQVILYSESGKIGKKFKYADAMGVPYVLVLGEEEVSKNSVTLRNMVTGEQEILSYEGAGDCILQEKGV